MACTGRACVLEIISMQTFAGQVTNFFHGSQVNLSGNAQLGGAWPLIPIEGKTQHFIAGLSQRKTSNAITFTLCFESKSFLVPQF